MNVDGGGENEANVFKRLKKLIEANQSLANIESLDALLPQLIALAKDVTGAEAASLLLYNPKRNVLEFATVREEGGDGRSEEILKSSVELAIGEGLAGWIAAKRKPIIVDDVQRDARFFRRADQETGFVTRTLLGVPVLSGDELLGVIEALNSTGKPCFDATDKELLESFAHLAAVAIIRARLLETQLKQQRLQIQLEAAAKIQSLFLPKLPELAGGSHAWAASLPATLVGGDLYDFIPIPDGSWLFYVADVSGKGLPAALIMVALWSRIKSEALLHAEVDILLEAVNNAMYDLLAQEGFFATILLGKYWPTTGRMQLARGGHLPPLWVVGNRVVKAPDLKGLALGVIPGAEYAKEECVLSSGESILLMSDGVTEAANERDELFGYLRLIDHVQTATGPPWGRSLVDAVKAWQGTAEASDDLTILEIWRDPP